MTRRALDQQKFALDQHAIVSITDRVGTITYANDRFCAISGYSQDELVGANHRIVKSGLHPDCDVRGHVAHHRAGQSVGGEVCNRRRDGSHYWVAATIDAAAWCRRFCGAIHRHSHRHYRARGCQGGAAARSRLLRGAITAIDEAFVIYDPQDRLVLCNDKYRRVFHDSENVIVEGATFESIVRYGVARGTYRDALGRPEQWVAERVAAHRSGNSTFGANAHRRAHPACWSASSPTATR